MCFRDKLLGISVGSFSRFQVYYQSYHIRLYIARLMEVVWIGLWFGLLSTAGWMNLITFCLEFRVNSLNCFFWGDDVSSLLSLKQVWV